MAQITLEPGEVFEHTHDTETTTGLVSGKAELRMAGRSFELRTDQKVVVPANVAHSVVNTGPGVAVCRCEYNCRS